MSEKLPYIRDGHLVIPFDAPEKYHYWKHSDKSRDTLRKILTMLNAPQEIGRRYLGKEE